MVLNFIYSSPDQNATFSRWLSNSELKDWPLFPLTNGKLLSCQRADKLLLKPDGAADALCWCRAVIACVASVNRAAVTNARGAVCMSFRTFRSTNQTQQ